MSSMEPVLATSDRHEYMGDQLIPRPKTNRIEGVVMYFEFIDMDIGGQMECQSDWCVCHGRCKPSIVWY